MESIFQLRPDEENSALVNQAAEPLKEVQPAALNTPDDESVERAEDLAESSAAPAVDGPGAAAGDFAGPGTSGSPEAGAGQTAADEEASNFSDFSEAQKKSLEYFTGPAMFDEQGDFKADVSYMIDRLEDIFSDRELDEHPSIREKYNQDFVDWQADRSPQRPEPPAKSAYLPLYDRAWFEENGFGPAGGYLAFDENGSISKPRFLAGQTLYETVMAQAWAGEEEGAGWFKNMVEIGGRNSRPGQSPSEAAGDLLIEIVRSGRPIDEVVANTPKTDLINLGGPLDFETESAGAEEGLESHSALIDNLAETWAGSSAEEKVELVQSWGQSYGASEALALMREARIDEREIFINRLLAVSSKNMPVKRTVETMTRNGPVSLGELERSPAVNRFLASPIGQIYMAINQYEPVGPELNSVLEFYYLLDEDLDSQVARDAALLGHYLPPNTKKQLMKDSERGLKRLYRPLNSPKVNALLPPDSPHDTADLTKGLDYLSGGKHLVFINSPGGTVFRAYDPINRLPVIGDHGRPVSYTLEEAAEMGRALKARAEAEQDLRKIDHYQSWDPAQMRRLQETQDEVLRVHERLQSSHDREKGSEAEIRLTRQAGEIKARLQSDGQARYQAGLEAPYQEAYGFSLAGELAKWAASGRHNGYRLASLLPENMQPDHPGGIFQLAQEVLDEHGIDPTAEPAVQLAQGGRALTKLTQGYDGDYAQAVVAFNKGTAFGDSFAEGRAELSAEDAEAAQAVLWRALDLEQTGLGLNFSPGSREKSVQMSDLQDSIPLSGGLDILAHKRYAEGFGSKVGEKLSALIPESLELGRVADQNPYTEEQLAEKINYYEANQDLYTKEQLAEKINYYKATRRLYTKEQLAEEINYYEARRRGLNVDKAMFKKGPVTLRNLLLRHETNNLKDSSRAEAELIPDNLAKSFATVGIDFGTDPLTWIPGSSYVKMFETVGLAGKVGWAVGGNALKAARTGEAFAPLTTAKETAKAVKNSRAFKYEINADNLESITFTRKWDRYDMELKNKEGITTVVPVGSDEAKALVKDLTGQEMAKGLEEIVFRSHDLLPRVKEGLTAAKSEALKKIQEETQKKIEAVAKEKISEEAKKKLVKEIEEEASIEIKKVKKMNAKVGSESRLGINAGDSADVVRAHASNPGANKYLFYGQLKDEPIPGLKKSIKKAKTHTRNTSFLNADGDVLSAYNAIQEFIAQYGKNALQKTPLFQTVTGRAVCNACMKDLPRLADWYGIPSVLLFDQKRKMFLFWRKGMKKELVPLGSHSRLVESMAIKGLAIGASRYNDSVLRKDELNEDSKLGSRVDSRP